MKMNFTHRIYQFALLSAILACCSAAFAEDVTLTARTYPTDVGKNGLPAGKTYCDLTAEDRLFVTSANAQFYFDSSADLVVPIFISGNATGSEKTGKFRLQNGSTVVNINGPVTLEGDTAIGSHTNGASGSIYFNNQISGVGAFIIGSGTGANVYFSNSTTNANNYAGNTQIGENGMYINPASGIAYLGANEQFPHGEGKGNLVMLNSSVLNMNSFTETVNGLESTSGSTTINGPGKLILGGNNTTASYAGNIAGELAVEKIGSGTQVLGGTNSYTGDTTVSGGTLEISKSFSGKNININNGSTLKFERPDNNYQGIYFNAEPVITFDGNGGGTLDSGVYGGSSHYFNLIVSSTMTFNTTGGAKDFIIGNNGFNLHNHNIIFNVAEGTDPSGVDLEVSARLWNNMGIQKTGAGTMLIKGDTANPNDYRGGTTINAGTLILGENGSLGSGNVTVAEGSTLEIQTQQGSTQTWNGGTISGAGTLNVSGSGAFTITPAQMQIADNGKFIVDGANVTLNNNSSDANGDYSGAEIFINNGGSVTFSRSGSKDQFWMSKQTTITFGDTGNGTFNAGGNNSINLVNNAQNKFVTSGGATNYIVGDSGFNLHSQNLTFDVAKGNDPDGKDLVVSARLWNGKGVVKEGAGTMVVTNGNNGYAGGTTINNGTLRLAENGVLGSGGVAIGANGALEFAYEADKTFGNAISGSGKIVKSGDNKVNLSGANTFTGDVNIQDGTLSTLINGTNKNLNITKLSGSGDLELRMASGSSDAKLSNLVNDGFTGHISLVQEGAASSTKINSGGKDFEGFTFAVNPGTSIFIINEFKADVLLAGNGNGESRGALRIASTFSGDTTVMANSIIGIDGTQTISGAITSGAASGEEVVLTINHTNNSGSGTFSNSISDGDTGSKLGMTVNKGTQTFSGDLSYTGATTVNSGAALTLTGEGVNLAASRAAVVNGTLNFNDYTGTADMQLNNLTGTNGTINGANNDLILNNGEDSTYSGKINVGTGSITKDGAGTLTISGTTGALTAGSYIINDGVLAVDIPGGLGNSSSIVVDEGATLSIKFNGNNKTFDAQNLSGSGVLEVLISNGMGNLQLTNLTTSDFSGTISLVNNGCTDSSKLYSNGQTYEGSTIVIGPDTTLYTEYAELKADLVVSGSGNSEKRGSLRANSDISGNITIMEDSIIGIDNSRTFSGAITSGAASGEEVVLTINHANNGGLGTFSKSISDGATGSKLGITINKSTQTFSGALSYTGATTINSGANIKLTGDGANLANSRAVAVNGTLDFAEYTGEDAMQFNNLTGTNGTITGGNNDLILNIAEDSFYSGKINIGTGTLTKKGVGNLKLLGANNGDLVAGAFNVDEGRLDVKEFFTGDISVKSAGILSPGNSIGTLRADGDFALDGGTLLMEIGGPTAADSDQLFVSGNLSLTDNSSILLQFTDGYALSPNAPFEVILDAANSESVDVLSLIDSYYYSNLSYGLNDAGFWVISGKVDPNAVPEPSTWALLILGAFGLALARRFQKRSK